VGQACKVQIKRDALGYAGSGITIPTGDSVNDTKVWVAGELRAVEKDAVILKTEKETLWIPKDSIFLIEKADAQP
jgi:hypothetical protein